MILQPPPQKIFANQGFDDCDHVFLGFTYLKLGTSSKKYSPKCEFDGDESVQSVQNHLQKTPAFLEASFSAMQLNCN